MSSVNLILALKRAKVRLSYYFRKLLIVKNDLHPKLNSVVFVDVSTGHKFLTKSTMKGSKTETIEGSEYQSVICDITSDSHPAFTGEKRFVDTAGRVEKFQTKFSRRR